MSTTFGRLFSLFIALIIALSAFIPMVSVGTLSSSEQYVPMPPGDFILYKDDHGAIHPALTFTTIRPGSVTSATSSWTRIAPMTK